MRALVLNGGGVKGAYQVGVLKYILGELRVKYDILCGVSVGAINAAFLSQFGMGEEIEGATKLECMWDQITTSNIYRRWKPWGRWHALWKTSFYDSSPLYDLVHKNIDLEKIRRSGKIVNVGTVSLNSGKYTIFNQTNNNFVNAVVASASFPGMLTPVKFDGQLWADGGIKEISPIKIAIDSGAEVVDIIMTSPVKRVKKFIENPTTVDVLKRSLDLSTDKIFSNDIEKIELHNKLAVHQIDNIKYIKLNIVRPDFNLSSDLLDFNKKDIKKIKDIGYVDAKSKFMDLV